MAEVKDTIEKVEEIIGKVEAPIEAKISEIEIKIEQWFTDHFHGQTAIHTDAYNIIYEAKERLKQILK